MASQSVAVLGVGAWGKNHVRVLNDLGVLRSAFDPDPMALARVPAERRCSRIEDVLGDPLVRAVVVATPAKTHFELAKAALVAGKDVLVEKPLTLDEDEGVDLVELASRLGRILMVGHLTLYHPGIVALRNLLREGVLGRPRYVYANRLNLGTVRETENILWSFAPHDIAVFLDLLQSWPSSVSAHGGSYLKEGRADVTVTHFEFSDGVLAHIFVSWLHPMKEHRLVVIGDRRMAMFVDGPEGGELRLFSVGAALGEDLNTAARGVYEVVAASSEEPLRCELKHFLDCIERRVEPLSGGQHGLQVLRILTTAEKSLHAGGQRLVCRAPENVTS